MFTVGHDSKYNNLFGNKGSYKYKAQYKDATSTSKIWQ